MALEKIDISSTAIERGVEMAKSFVDKLIIPSIEETGLLIKSQISFWRFKNQVKMLNKAKAYCEKHNINPKTISLKLLCPLLDYSAIEEDEELQDIWATLLSNMVDSEQNIQNHVFPYILSQISSNEFALIQNVYKDKLKRQRSLSIELEEFLKTKPENVKNIELQIAEIKGEIKAKIESGINRYSTSMWDLEKRKTSLEKEVRSYASKESRLNYQLRQPEAINISDIKEYELSNIIRLGLVKFIQRPYANSQTLEIPYDREDDSSGYYQLNLDIDVDTDEEYVLTELGEMFVIACSEKNSL